MSVQEFTTIRGYVTALAPNSGAEDAARVAVVTEDGTGYLVRHKGAGAELTTNINANVEVTGTVSDFVADDDDEEPEASFVITVKSYRLTDGFDDPWYDDSVR